jgi:uracil-DNA glycosylase family 4
MIDLNDIVTNAQMGRGPCGDCPAHKVTKGWCVNPGLSNFDGKIMFVTQEPSHDIEWGKYSSWSEYNKIYTLKFMNWPGGRSIQKNYLDPIDLTISDVWIADSIKCRLKNQYGKKLFDESTAFDHCQKYLMEEIETINPRAVVTLGLPATKRTLLSLGVPIEEVNQIRVSTDYGYSRIKTKWPVIISPHWAQRNLRHSDYFPVIQQALKEIFYRGQGRVFNYINGQDIK